MNNEILDSLRRISCGMEIVMRDVIEEKYNMDRDYIEIEDWELELEEVIGKGVVEGWKEINRVIERWRSKMNVNELMYDLEECKLEVESVLWEIVCDKRGVESVEDLDDRLLLVECMDDFYGGDNWELFKWWMELEEVFMWLYDLSNE